MSLEDEIKHAIQEEEQSVLHYMKMVQDAESLGLLDEASTMREIAGDERRHAGMMREIIRERQPMSLGEYYWEVANMDTKEILQHDTAYTTVSLAVQSARDYIRDKLSHFANQALVIKVFTGSPSERVGVPYDVYPVVLTENYYMVREGLTSGQAGADVEELRGRQARDRAEEVLGRISQPLGGWTMRDRPFPTTYNDWVNLGMDIKEKAGINDYETTAQVNRQLAFIADEDDAPSAAALSKRWLTNKAAELGIR